MKYCEEYAALISAFVDGEATEAEQARLLEHFETCPHCRAYWEELLALRGAFQCDAPEPPRDFTARVMGRVRADKARQRRRRTWALVSSAAACLVLVLALRLIPSGGGMGANAAAPESADQVTDYTASSEPYDDALSDTVITQDDTVKEQSTPSRGESDAGEAENDPDTPAAAAETVEVTLTAGEAAWFAANSIAGTPADGGALYYLSYEEYTEFAAAMADRQLPSISPGTDICLRVLLQEESDNK